MSNNEDDEISKFEMGEKSFIKGANWKKQIPKRGHRRNVSEGMINLNNNNNNNNSSSSSSSSNYGQSIIDPIISKSMSMPGNDLLRAGSFAFPYSLGSSSLAWMGNCLDSVDVDVITAPSIDEFGSPHKKGPPLKKATHRRAHSETLNESFLAEFFHSPSAKPDGNSSNVGLNRPNNNIKQVNRSNNTIKMNQLLASQDVFEGTLGMSIDETVIAPLLKVSSEDWHETFQKQSEGSNEYHEMDFFRSHSFDAGNNGYQVTAEMAFSSDIAEMPNYSSLFQKPLPFLPASSSSGEDKPPWNPSDISTTDSLKETTSAPPENVEAKTKKNLNKEKVIKEKSSTKLKKQKDKDQLINDEQHNLIVPPISVPTVEANDSMENEKVILATIKTNFENSKTNINHGPSANENSISSTIWHNAKDYYEKSGNASEDGGSVSDYSNQQHLSNDSANNEKLAGRGRYRCGRCGVLKTNHKCEYIEADICSTGTQAVVEVICQQTGMPFDGDVVMAVSNRASIHEPKVTYTNVDESQDPNTTWYRYPDGTLCLPSTAQHEYTTVENTAATTYSYVDADGNVALLGPNQAIHYEPDGTAYIITYDTAVNNSMAYSLAGLTINSDGTITNELMQMNISADPNVAGGLYVNSDMSYYAQSNNTELANSDENRINNPKSDTS